MWKIVIWLSISGIVLAVYLLFEQVTHSPFQICNINSIVNCNAIISGSVSKTLGIPTPLIGLVGYVIIFISVLLHKRRLFFGMATFGVVFCLWIAFQELFLLHVICPLCILCQLIMLTIFTCSIFLQKEKEKLSY